MMQHGAAGPLSAFLEALPVDGGSITAISRNGLSSTVVTSDLLAGRLDAFQADLGEGPRWEARRTGAPVIISDISAAGAGAGWPMFAAALAETSVEGVFAFPLLVGMLVVGAVDLYSCAATTDWDEGQIADGARVAAAVARPIVRLAARSAAAAQPTSGHGAAELRREVHQATGIVVALLDVPPDEALAILQAHAFAMDRPLLDVARDVVNRRIGMDALIG